MHPLSRVSPMDGDGGGGIWHPWGGEISPIPQLPGDTGQMWRSRADGGTSPTSSEPMAPLRCGGKATAGPGDKCLPGPDSLPGSVPAQGLAIRPPANLEPGQDEALPGSHPAERVETPEMTRCRSRRYVIDGAACNSPAQGLTAHVMAIHAPFVFRSRHLLPPYTLPCARHCLSSPFPPAQPPLVSWSHGRRCRYCHPSFPLTGPMSHVLHPCWVCVGRDCKRGGSGSS